MTRFIDWAAYYRVWLLYFPVVLVVNGLSTLACLLTYGKIFAFGYDITSSVCGITSGCFLGWFSSRMYTKRVSVVLSVKPFLWPRHWWRSTQSDPFERMLEEDAVHEWCKKRGQPMIYWRSSRSSNRFYGFKSADLMVECRMTV